MFYCVYGLLRFCCCVCLFDVVICLRLLNNPPKENSSNSNSLLIRSSDQPNAFSLAAAGELPLNNSY